MLKKYILQLINYQHYRNTLTLSLIGFPNLPIGHNMRLYLIHIQ
jgi:hypothetical protein